MKLTRYIGVAGLLLAAIPSAGFAQSSCEDWLKNTLMKPAGIQQFDRISKERYQSCESSAAQADCIVSAQRGVDAFSKLLTMGAMSKSKPIDNLQCDALRGQLRSDGLYFE